MSDFDKWFTEHVDDFVEGEYARSDCQLAWKARQPEIDRLQKDNIRYRKALEEIIARGTDYDSTINELVYIAKEAVGEVQGE